VYNQLVALANKNYWAGMIVRGIKGLTSGRLHMDNVFVQKETRLAYGKGLFYVVLPGVTATLEDCEDGTYLLKSLTADMNYLQLQKDKQKPGLWRVSEDKREPPKFREDGWILNKEYRSVVIGDRAADDPHQVALAAREDLVTINATVKDMVRHSGFDLHHTPGKGGIVGLVNAKQALANEEGKALVESATLLANTMYSARNVQGVLWFADWGGSAVLTRALQILKGQNLKLPKHSVFLNRPTSVSTQALKLAEDVDMTVAGTGKNAGLRPSEIVGNHLFANLSRTGLVEAGVWSAAGVGAASTVGLLGGTAVGPTVVGAASVVGAMYFVTSTIRSGAKNFKGKKYK
jgi:hypothetical protein